MDRVLTPRGVATRQRIVEGAAELIRDRGVAGVALDDIRAATATSKSQLFHYFPAGKADLLLAVARHEADQVIADQQPQLGDLTSWQNWQAWRHRVIQMYDSQRQHCPLSALLAQLGNANPAVQTVVVDLNKTWLGYLVAGVQSLKDTGEIDPKTDAERAGVAILAAVTGGATLLQATDEISYLETALTEALRNLQK